MKPLKSLALLGYLSPIEYEKAHYAGELVGSADTSTKDSHQVDHVRHNDKNINPRDHEPAG